MAATVNKGVTAGAAVQLVVACAAVYRAACIAGINDVTLVVACDVYYVFCRTAVFRRHR